MGVQWHEAPHYGVVQKPGIFLNDPKSRDRVFFYSYRFLRWWAPCRQEDTRSVIFPAFCGCERILGRESTDVILCFHFLPSPFILNYSHVPFILHYSNCLSCCINFLSFSLHVLSCSVAMYGRYNSSKADMLKPVRWVSAQTLALFSYFVIALCYRLAIVLEACAGCHFQASWTCTCISSLSFFYSYRFLGRQCIGSVKVQAKLKWNARGY